MFAYGTCHPHLLLLPRQHSLAKKLESCGVFGVSSYEYLGNAQKNREAGVLRGREVVEEMKEKLLATFLPQSLQPRLSSLTPPRPHRPLRISVMVVEQ